ncbi:MBL fold metallo-hydrolase [Patescibacteria group bacterium]|nr:MBL fold metallo-hydrolase [Patescibacteria group bacterium]
MKELEVLKKPLFWLILILILLWGVVFSLPDKQLHLVFCDVDQGDAILISYLQTQVLIDGGPDNKILGCLSKNMPFWDRKIEIVVLTHPEEDHFGGLIDVFKRYNVRYFVSNGLIKSSASFTELEQSRRSKKVLPLMVKVGDKIKISSLQFLFLWPEKGDFKTDDFNDSSVVLKLVYGDFEALFPGDISEKVEKLLDLPAGGVEILKVAHHGSKFSTSEEFLRKIKPKLAVISVGKNRFGHPTLEVLERLNQAGIRVLRTDQQGEIEIVSNGWGWYNRL